MITATQSFRIYETLEKHFKNKEDAKIVVTEIENIIESRFKLESDRLATKEDLANTKNDIVKWVFGVFVALALMIIGLYFKA